MAGEDRKEPVLDTPELILKNAVLKFKKLDEEAEEALSQEDTVMCRQKLVERARLIVDLPARIKQVMEGGQSFPEEELHQLEDFSELASKGLKDGRSFAVGVFLKPEKGSLESEPNLLEELVNKLYPLKKR